MKRSIIALFVLCRVSTGFEVGDAVKVNLAPYSVNCVDNQAVVKRVHSHSIRLYELSILNCKGNNTKIFAVEKDLTFSSASTKTADEWNNE